MPPNPAQNPQSVKRPGCVTAFASLLVLAALFLILAGIAIYLGAQPSFTRRPDEAMGVLLFVVIIFIVACAPLFIAWGLWKQKSWSRISAILLILIVALATPFVFYWFREVFIEISGENYLPPLIFGSSLGIMLDLFVLRWFARHKEFFQN